MKIYFSLFGSTLLNFVFMELMYMEITKVKQKKEVKNTGASRIYKSGKSRVDAEINLSKNGTDRKDDTSKGGIYIEKGPGLGIADKLGTNRIDKHGIGRAD